VKYSPPLAVPYHAGRLDGAAIFFWSAIVDDKFAANPLHCFPPFSSPVIPRYIRQTYHCAYGLQKRP
jgi:hypothetical protein